MLRRSQSLLRPGLAGTLRVLPATAVLVALLHPAPVAGSEPDGGEPQPVRVVRFDISPPLRDAPGPPPAELGVEIADPWNSGFPVPSALLPAESVAVTPAPNLDFEGLSNADSVAVAGDGPTLAHPQGDIGPDHYVQWVNKVVGIWSVQRDANRHPTSATLLTGFPKAGNSFFSGFGGDCETSNWGSPIVLYDHLADRWLATQYKFGTSSSPQCIALSTTPDPTGTYYRWEFNLVEPPADYHDWYVFGLLPDAYFISYREVDWLVPTYTPVAGAFDRHAMLAGDPNPGFVRRDFPADVNGAQPPHLEGPPPPAGTPGTFSKVWDGATDSYRLWEFNPDFQTPASSSFSELLPAPGAASLDTDLCIGGECVPQLMTPQKLKANAQYQMYRAQYRHHAGSHASIVLNTTVDMTSANQAGIRWAELRDDGDGWALFQEGTYTTGDDVHRWQGSAAMDASGNIALGYSASSSLIYPSIRYTSRVAADTPGTLPGGEVELQAGGGAQTNPNGGWGFLSAMSVDPSDACTFWYTNEYYAATSDSGWSTRIGAFRLPDCQFLCPYDDIFQLTNASPEMATASVFACDTVTLEAYSVGSTGSVSITAGELIVVEDEIELGGSVELALDPFLASP